MKTLISYLQSHQRTQPPSNMSTQVDEDRNSMYESQHEDCPSEDSFGSDFGDNATDEESDLTTTATGVDIEPHSPPPGYPDEKCPQPTFLPVTMDLIPPPMALTTLSTNPTEPNSNTNFKSGRSMCVVCKLAPAYSKGRSSYPTCGLTCASKLSNVPTASSNMCDVCHVRPRFQRAGKVYPTCGLTCAAVLANSPTSPKENASTLNHLGPFDNHPSHQHSPQGKRRNSCHHSSQPEADDHFRSDRGSTSYQPCVVCLVRPCRDGKYVTCGRKCAERLCGSGSANPRMCDYCHRRPKVAGHNQCGKTCGNNASRACLLCKSRPRFGRYHLCGRTCYKIAAKWTPLILEARPGHTVYHEVENRFKRAWKDSNTSCPAIKKIYKIIENKSFLRPYDQYKRQVGREAFRYHGTSRACTLGSQGNTRLCSFNTCALCSILRTSFRVSLANPSGAFGAGVYTSSASNKAFSYTQGGTGAIILTKVVLGTIYNVQSWNQVKSCPPGYNSVVFDRQNGKLNETIVYTDDAIRPVYLIIF